LEIFRKWRGWLDVVVAFRVVNMVIMYSKVYGQDWMIRLSGLSSVVHIIHIMKNGQPSQKQAKQ